MYILSVHLKRAPNVAHFDIDRFELSVIVERSHAIFSSDAGAFVAAERQLTRENVIVVDVNASGLKRRHNSMCASQISADHTDRQSTMHRVTIGPARPPPTKSAHSRERI